MNLYVVYENVPSIEYGFLYTGAIAVYDSEEQAKEVVDKLNEYFECHDRTPEMPGYIGDQLCDPDEVPIPDTNLFFNYRKLESKLNTYALYDYLVERGDIL